MAVDTASEPVAASLKDPKDLLFPPLQSFILLLASKVFFFKFVFVLFSHSSKHFAAKFSCFFSPYKAKGYSLANFLVPFVWLSRFSVVGLLVFFLIIEVETFYFLVNMGLVGSLGCMNSYSKKQCMALFWRLKAAVRRTVKRNGRKKRFKFQYDPSSYALNFDDGCCKLGASGYAVKHDNATINDSKEMLWVYVLWVEP